MFIHEDLILIPVFKGAACLPTCMRQTCWTPVSDLHDNIAAEKLKKQGLVNNWQIQVKPSFHKTLFLYNAMIMEGCLL